MISNMAGKPCCAVDVDSEGITTVTVKEEHLRNFLYFVAWIVKERIGAEVGGFKIALHESVVNLTPIEELLGYIKNYFQNKAPCEMGTSGVRRPVRQTFFYGSANEHLYGYKVGDGRHACTDAQAAAFVNKVSDPRSYENVETCCTEALKKSELELFTHYWSMIRNNSQKSESLDLNELDVDIEKLLQNSENDRKQYCKGLEADPQPSASGATHSSSVVTELKAKSSNGTGREVVLHGAGISLAAVSFFIFSGFSLSKLGTILDLSPIKYPGLASSHLFVGMNHSSFPWHIEDVALYSINYLHYGANKVWFVVPPEFYKKFVDWCRVFCLDLGHVSCTNVLGHKYLLASSSFLHKLGIPVYTIIQREREFVVTLPYCAHSGFNMGINVAEAANFGDPHWVDLAVFAPTCECMGEEIQMDLKEIIAVARPHLLRDYVRKNLIGLVNSLASNQLVRAIGILPPLALSLESDVLKMEEQQIDVQGREDENLVDTEEVIRVPSFRGARAPVMCPECNMQYVGGRSKLPRLVEHARTKHPELCPKLIETIKLSNPCKGRNGKGLICTVCNCWKKGNIAHLKLHHKRVHQDLPFVVPLGGPVVAPM